MSWEKKQAGKRFDKLEDQIRGAMEALTKRVMVLESRLDAEIRSIKHEVDKLTARINGFINGIGFERRGGTPKGGRQREGPGGSNPGEY